MSERENSSAKSGGIGFAGLLTILFIGLKLTNYIDWSWWWVLSPIWLPITVVFGFAALFFMAAAVLKRFI